VRPRDLITVALDDTQLKVQVFVDTEYHVLFKNEHPLYPPIKCTGWDVNQHGATDGGVPLGQGIDKGLIRLWG
jgi:hypothetical protein